MCVFMCQLHPIAAPESQCINMAVGGGMQPGNRVEAVISKGLPSAGTQELQKRQLDNMDGNTVWASVGKLVENKIIQVY